MGPNGIERFPKEEVHQFLLNLKNVEENKCMIIIVLLSRDYQYMYRIEKYFFWNNLDYSIIENKNLIQVCKYVEAININSLSRSSGPELNLEPLILEEYFYNWFVSKYCYTPPVPEDLKHKQD